MNVAAQATVTALDSIEAGGAWGKRYLTDGAAHRSGRTVYAAASSFRGSGKFTPSYSICKIVEVGSLDLALISHPSRSYDRIFMAPKSCCVKISTASIEAISSGVTPPKLNDLVIAFSTSSSAEILTGIVYAIEYASGSPRNCKILVGEFNN